MPNPILPSQIALGSIYNLNMIAVTVFGQLVENVKVVAIMDYDTAKMFAPVDAIHGTVVAAQINPQLLPVSCKASQFFKFVSINNPEAQPMYYSSLWITDAVLLQNLTVTVTLQLTAANQLDLVKAALAYLYPAVIITSLVVA